VPVPLRIDIEHGEGDIEQVAKDILSLTKLNYNACKLGDSEPVTVAFSDAVGEILVSNPTVKERRPNFKFYI
jgi:2-methylisocitrate lyase-like PEP mutase family enzyme